MAAGTTIMAGGLLGTSSVVGQEEDEEWYSTRADSWPSVDGTSGNNAVTSGEGPGADPEVAWSAEGGPAAVADGTVYTVSNGAVRALDAEDGSVEWETGDIGADGTPAVDGDTVYVGGQQLIGIEGDSGEVCCEIEFDGADDLPSPNVADGLAFVVVDGDLCGADVHEEEVEWWFEPDEQLYAQPVAVSDGAVFATSESALFARELEDGSSRWTDDDPGENHVFAEPTDRQLSTPVAADGVVSVGRVDTERSGMWPIGDVGLYDTETGEEHVRSEMSSHTPGPVIGDRFYARDSHNLTGYDRQTGEEAWEPEVITYHVESVIVQAETVYAGLYIDGEGYRPDEMPDPQSGVYAFDPESGETEWAVETDPDDGTGPTLALADGTIYASSDGTLRAIRDGDEDDPEEDDGLELSVSAPESAPYEEEADPSEDAVDFEVSVTNHGDESISADVTLEIGPIDEPVTLDLDPGEHDVAHYGIMTRDLGVGDHEWTVTANDETETGTLTVTDEDDEPVDDVAATTVELSVSAPDSIARGESASFDVTVWNHGDEADEVTVTLEAGDVSDSTTVEIAPGDCYASFHTVPCGDLSVGDTEWTVTAGEQTESGTLTVTE